jgi:hypothetical protein
VEKILTDAKDGAGKVDKAKARKAAKEAAPTRAKTKPSKLISAVADVLAEGDGGVKVATALRWAAGESEEPPTWLQKAIDAAKEAQ